ncbi:MAG: CPBP family intramembrane glutamic endopeptidase [Rickettsiales bacterium]
MELLITNYSFILITFSVILRLFNKFKKLSIISYACALGVALGQNYIEPIGFAYILTAVAAIILFYKKNNHLYIKVAAFFFIAIFGYNLLAHQLPGFNNIQLLYEKLSPDSEYYSLWLNYDSTFFASFIFIKAYKPIGLKKHFKVIFQGVAYGAVISLILSFICLHYGIIRLDTTVPDIIWLWLWIVSLYAIFSESFYRMFFIDFIREICPGSLSWLFVTIITSSFLFAYSHSWAGSLYVYASFLAGVVYCVSYIKSGYRVESSSVTHIMVNVLHFIFFTYPFYIQTS